MDTVENKTRIDWKKIYLKEAHPFTKKRDINWFAVKIIFGVLVLVVVTIILIWPSSQPIQKIFHEKIIGRSSSNTSIEPGDPTHEAVGQIQSAQVNSQQVHSSLDHLYRQERSSPGGGGANQPNRNSGMILAREGFDSRTQLSPGTRVIIRLTQGVSVSEEAVPIIGIVQRDVNADLGPAIPSGSKVLGDVSFESSSEKVSVTWRSIILPDGRERPFSAMGTSSEEHSELRAKIRSESVKNVIGQTLTKFVGAYAAGSMNTGAFGANLGGGKNGLRNAISQTATERAEAMGEQMQQERKWAELSVNQDIIAVLTQPFSFRDPGGTYGR